MSALKLVASNAAPQRSEDPSIAAMLDQVPHAKLIEICVDSGVLEPRAAPSRSELATALFQLCAKMRLGRAMLELTGTSDAVQALAVIDRWQMDAARAAELEGQLLELERKAEHRNQRDPLEELLAEGQRTYKLTPAMVNRWRGLYDSGEATVGSLRNMLDMLAPIPALANGRA